MLKSGERVNKYEIIGEIGKGGEAVVYKALDTFTGDAVAVKVIHDYHVKLDPEFTHLFLREGKILSRLDDPGVIKIFESNVCATSSRQIYYHAMELINAETLSHHMQTRKFNWKEIIRILHSLTESVRNFHDRPDGILHRDLKPSNLFLLDVGSANTPAKTKIFDFGLARTEFESTVTSSDVFRGTVKYSAPELQKTGGKATSATDIYALGKILDEMLGTEPPVNVPEWVFTLRNIMCETVPEYRPTAAEVLNIIIEQTEKPKQIIKPVKKLTKAKHRIRLKKYNVSIKLLLTLLIVTGIAALYFSYPAMISGLHINFVIPQIAPKKWVKTWGSESSDRCRAVAKDKNGDIYVTGSYEGTVNLKYSIGTDEHKSYGMDDAFLIKYTKSGKRSWVKSWGGSSSDFGMDVAVDNAGFIYVTGIYENDVNFDPSSAGLAQKSIGMCDAFLCQFNPEGDLIWVRSFGGNDNDMGLGIATDGISNIYLSGTFRDEVDFDPGSEKVIRKSKGMDDVFLIKVDNNGNFLSVYTFGGKENDSGKDIVVDAESNVLVVGDFSDRVDFNPGKRADRRTSKGALDVYYARFDSDCNFQGVLSWGGKGDDFGNAITVDKRANVFITGSFSDEVDFNPDSRKTETRESNGETDVYFSRFMKSGVFIGVCTWGGQSGDSGQAIAVDSSSNVHVSGYFTGFFDDKIDFNPAKATCWFESAGKKDIFLSKFTSTSNFDSVRIWGGTSDDEALDIACSLDSVFIVGDFQNDAAFLSKKNKRTSEGKQDVFIMMTSL